MTQSESSARRVPGQLGRLVYASNMSLDGWTEDDQGRFDWAPPDDEVFAAITELMRSAGSYLYGRRMYQVLAPWQTDPALAAHSELMGEYAKAWQAAHKVVYSTTLTKVTTPRTRLEDRFDPSVVQQLKREADSDLLVGGPNLAAQAFHAGLVDEIQLFVWPIMLGGRAAALPSGVRAELELVAERRFGNGVLQLRYQPAAQR